MYKQIQEVQRIPKKMNPNRPTQRYIIIEMTNIKLKDRILKATRERHLVIYNIAAITV